MGKIKWLNQSFDLNPLLVSNWCELWICQHLTSTPYTFTLATFSSDLTIRREFLWTPTHHFIVPSFPPSPLFSEISDPILSEKKILWHSGAGARVKKVKKRPPDNMENGFAVRPWCAPFTEFQMTKRIGFTLCTSPDYLEVHSDILA